MNSGGPHFGVWGQLAALLSANFEGFETIHVCMKIAIGERDSGFHLGMTDRKLQSESLPVMTRQRRQAGQRVDILLTSEWPDRLWLLGMWCKRWSRGTCGRCVL